MPDAKPITENFNAQSGLCNQGGHVALDASASEKMQERFIVDGLTGGAETQRAASQSLPNCKNPIQVSNVVYTGRHM